MKSIDTKEAWVVMTNTDLTEGKGKQIPLHVCLVEATALRMAKKAYVMGTDAPVASTRLVSYSDGVWLGPVVIVPPTHEDMVEQAKLDAHRRAVKKAKEAGLSDAEIAALRGNP